MTEIFRDASPILVGHYKSILQSHGILCMVRNESIALTEIPIPVFYPALNVMNDEDAGRAIQILEDYQMEEKSLVASEDKTCPQCGEMNPSNFDVCWSCSHEFAQQA